MFSFLFLGFAASTIVASLCVLVSFHIWESNWKCERDACVGHLLPGDCFAMKSVS